MLRYGANRPKSLLVVLLKGTRGGCYRVINHPSHHVTASSDRTEAQHALYTGPQRRLSVTKTSTVEGRMRKRQNVYLSSKSSSVEKYNLII